MADLLAFCRRDDLNPLTQASLAHAQFESIHPFTDGNGRIGRALTNAVLRRRGVTTGLVVPIASALVHDRDAYFSYLDAYRNGDGAPITLAFARASKIAAEEAMVTAARFKQTPEQWHHDAGKPRRASTASRLIDRFLEQAIFTADEAEKLAGASTSATYDALRRLEETGVVRPLTARKRDRVWIVASISAELESLASRIAERAAQRD